MGAQKFMRSKGTINRLKMQKEKPDQYLRLIT